jgi:hypothetical protein
MADNQCYNKQIQNHSVGQLVGFGAGVYYWKEVSTKKSKYRPLKAFGFYLLGNILGHNVMNLVNTPPQGCTLKTALGITNGDTTTKIPDQSGFGTSPTGSPSGVSGLASCGTCRDRF